MGRLLFDFRYALRGLRKSAGFALVVVLMLALGIGANTAMFTVIRAVLLKPLSYPDPDTLVELAGGASMIRFEETRAASLVMGQGLGLTIAGIVIGVGGTLMLTEVIKGFLFQISATDPLTYVATAALFVVVALVATYIPARRASRVDPVSALRA